MKIMTKRIRPAVSDVTPRAARDAHESEHCGDDKLFSREPHTYSYPSHNSLNSHA